MGEWFLKNLTEERVQPVDDAIAATCAEFSDIEDLATTLKLWLKKPEVLSTLGAFADGFIGLGEIPAEALASALIKDGGFFLEESSQSSAVAIVMTFLDKLRTEILQVPQLAAQYQENQSEARYLNLLARFDDLQSRLPSTTVSVTAGMTSSRLKATFDRAYSRLEGKHPIEAKTLFDALIEEIRSSDPDNRELLAKSLTNRANALLQLGQGEEACISLDEAREAQDSPLTRLNAAIAKLIRNDPQSCLADLEAIGEHNQLSPQFWSAKLNALSQVGRGAEALELALALPNTISEAERKELLGTALMQNEKYVEAQTELEEAANLAADNPEFWFRFAESIYAPILHARNDNPIPASFADPHEKQRLRQCLEVLERARKLARDAERDQLFRDIQANIGTVLMALGEFEKAIAEYRVVSEGPHHEPSVWRSLGICLLLTGKADESISALRHVPEAEEHLGTESILFHALLAAGKAKEAVAFAEERATSPVTPENLQWHVWTAEALRADRQFRKAENVISDLKTRFGSSPEFSISLAEHYEAIGDVELAYRAYEHAMVNGSSSIAGRSRLLYGRLLYQQHDYQSAAEIFEPIVPRDEPSSILGMYLYALHRTEKHGRVLSIVSELFDQGKELPEPIVEIAAVSAEILFNLGLAKKLYGYLATMYGNQTKHVTRLAVCLYRTGDRNGAAELLAGVRLRLNESSDLLAAAEAFSATSDYLNAVEAAHAAAQAAPNDPRVQLTFAWLAMVAGKHIKGQVTCINVKVEGLSKSGRETVVSGA
jgi:tetratricopeptide (TPR) repeat protein